MDYNKAKENADKMGVSVEVYKFLCSSNRKMRYMHKERKAERVIVEDNKVTFISAKEDSYEWFSDLGTEFAAEEKSVEDIIIERETIEQLRDALNKLSDDERGLIDALYFERNGNGSIEREVGAIFGLTQQGVSRRKKKIIEKLKKIMEI